MGLDMYAYTMREEPAEAFNFHAPDARDMHYWRKHPNLHGWMEKLYREKGGTDDNFNCVNLRLTAADLDALEVAIRERTLPHTTGFFFGESAGDEIEDDLAFVEKARAAIADGLIVFYSSWW